MCTLIATLIALMVLAATPVVAWDWEDGKAVYKTAKQGDATAQLKLGLMYAQGKGVPDDYARGYAWVSIAAAQGNARGKKGKENIAKLMTPA